MKRAYSEFDDSLELLLDTICNVFGGIVFIAMLVALLTNARAGAMPEPPKLDGEIVTVTSLMESQQAYEQIRQASDDAVLNIEMYSDDGAEESLAQVDAIEEKLKAAKIQSDRLAQWLAEFDAINIEQEETLKQRSALADAKLKQLEAEVQKIEQLQTQELRMPIARQTAKLAVILVLKGGRIYAVPIGGTTTLLRTFTNDVTIQPNVGYFRVTPNANSGCLGDANLENAAWFKQLMSTINPQRQHLDMFIYPDSIDAFQAIRTAALKRGYEYGVTPMGAGEELDLVFTNQSRTVQ